MLIELTIRTLDIGRFVELWHDLDSPQSANQHKDEHEWPSSVSIDQELRLAQYALLSLNHPKYVGI
jgi:hypothetical protein